MFRIRKLFAKSDKSTQSALIPFIPTAWAESPALAIELCTRFQSPRIHKEVRSLLLKHPEKGVSEPEALTILLGSSMPADLSSQLKVCLYVRTARSFLTDIHSIYFFGRQ